LPTLSIENGRGIEGDIGSTEIVFVAKLSESSGRRITAQYRATSGTALAGSDFDSAEGDLVFPPGVTNLSFRVQARGDLINEPDEVFFVHLTNQINATL